MKVIKEGGKRGVEIEGAAFSVPSDQSEGNSGAEDLVGCSWVLPRCC